MGIFDFLSNDIEKMRVNKNAKGLLRIIKDGTIPFEKRLRANEYLDECPSLTLNKTELLHRSVLKGYYDRIPDDTDAFRIIDKAYFSGERVPSSVIQSLVEAIHTMQSAESKTFLFAAFLSATQKSITLRALMPSSLDWLLQKSGISEENGCTIVNLSGAVHSILQLMNQSGWNCGEITNEKIVFVAYTGASSVIHLFPDYTASGHYPGFFYYKSVTTQGNLVTFTLLGSTDRDRAIKSTFRAQEHLLNVFWKTRNNAISNAKIIESLIQNPEPLYNEWLGKALEECNIAIALAPEYPYAWHNRGIALILSGNISEGFASLQKAAKEDSQYLKREGIPVSQNTWFQEVIRYGYRAAK